MGQGITQNARPLGCLHFRCSFRCCIAGEINRDIFWYTFRYIGERWIFMAYKLPCPLHIERCFTDRLVPQSVDYSFDNFRRNGAVICVVLVLSTVSTLNSLNWPS